MKRKFIEIYFDEKEGRFETVFIPFNGLDGVKIGVGLASATRVISGAICDLMKLPKSEQEQIQALICEVYNRDMGWESMGEEDSVKRIN